MDAVVKVGGSLGRGDGLRDLCAALAAAGRRYRLLVVPGGGAFADVVRDHDRRYGLSAGAAHRMAILAMDQYAFLLADMIPGATTVRSPAAAAEQASAGRVAVLLCHDYLREHDELPHSWDVTSDSIAAWVAKQIAAPLLVLLKSGAGLSAPFRDGLPAPFRDGPPAPAGTLPLHRVSQWDCVDGHLADVLAGTSYDLWVIDGERPKRLTELLDGGATTGVRLDRGVP